MKRVEVKLSLPVVEPLLGVIKAAGDSLDRQLAAPLAMTDLEAEFRDAWSGELVAGQNHDVQTLLGLFGSEFFDTGTIAFDEDNAEPIVRACSAVRLRLRARFLTGLSDETLESGEVDLVQLEEDVRKAFTCYIFLATVQELIIQHFDSTILGS